jgi:hypothetical protein
MGILSTENEEHLESIVYFLSEALRAAIEAGDSLQQSICDIPQMDPQMECGEIAQKLAAFRQCTHFMWSREVLMIAKILRARDLSKELRLYDPELKPEIDTFRLATVISADLQELLLPDAQNLFNGAVQPKRFLESRGHDLTAENPAQNPLLGYKIAGRMDVRLLLDACEVLHFGLTARYGFDALPGGDTDDLPAPTAADFERLTEDGEAPFLLTDFAEMVGDVASPLAHEWRAAVPETPNLRH